MTARRVDGVVLEGSALRLCAWLVCVRVDELLRRDGGALPAGTLELRDLLSREAGRETVAVVVSEERELGKPAGAVTVVDSRPAEITAQPAARLIGVSVQTVRKLCRNGDLIARRDHAGRWAIDAGSAADLAARRGQR